MKAKSTPCKIIILDLKSMSVCQLRTPALQHVGGIPEKFAIVPDIYSLVSDYSCKRGRSDSRDCLGIGEELELLGQFQDTKRPCGYSISPPSDQFQLVENSQVFTAKVKENYNFGGSEDAKFFTCGGNSPVSTSSSSPGADFTPTGQVSEDCQLIDFQGLVLFPEMQPQSQAVLSAHADKYKLVITEQPEEVCM